MRTGRRRRRGRGDEEGKISERGDGRRRVIYVSRRFHMCHVFLDSSVSPCESVNQGRQRRNKSQHEKITRYLIFPLTRSVSLSVCLSIYLSIYLSTNTSLKYV